ncbi:MAG: hypothetical protein Q9174_005241 [Haloplaca sp. 1 TL-2023]
MEALLDSLGPLSPCADDSRRAEPRKKDQPVEHPLYKRFLARINRVRWGDGYKGGPDEAFFEASDDFCNEILFILEDLCHSFFPDVPNGAVYDPDCYEDIDQVIPLVLNYVETESKRLLEDPELFPSEFFEGEFVWSLESMAIFTIDAIQWVDIHDEGKSRKLRKLLRHDRRRYLPNTDEARTPWQQFLHGRAPGAGFPKNSMSSDGHHQFLTRGCAHMLGNHRSDWNECGTMVQDYVASQSIDSSAPRAIKSFRPVDAKVAGHDPHEGFSRSRRPVEKAEVYQATHWATSTRPMPSEPVTNYQDMSLRALSALYLFQLLITLAISTCYTFRPLTSKTMSTDLEQSLKAMTKDQLEVVFQAVGTRDINVLLAERGKPLTGAKPQHYAGVIKSRKGNDATKIGKPKVTRSVNSFMGFRCFYAVLFEEFQQKVISTYIVTLWDNDPFKAKWALVAKAYSVIRDEAGKERAPLDEFLMLVADFVGIIKPEHYLPMLGWEIAVDEAGSVSLLQDEDYEVDSSLFSTNLSVEDIIAYAGHHGYAGMSGLTDTGSSTQPSMTMAAAAQPPAAQELNSASTANLFDADPIELHDFADWDPEVDFPEFNPVAGDAFNSFEMSAWFNDSAFAN